MMKCPVCEVSVKPENLEKHVANLHPRANVDMDELLGAEERKKLRSRSRGARPTVSRGGVQIVAVVAIVLAIILILVAFNPFQGVGPGIGQQAPDFTLTSTEGAQIRLSAYEGKPVLLEFMDVDCGFCQQEARDVLPGLYADYSTRVQFLSVNVDFVGTPDDNAQIETFKATYGTSWPYALDTTGVHNRYGVSSTPTTFIIDREGVVSDFFIGVPQGGASAMAAALDVVLGG